MSLSDNRRLFYALFWSFLTLMIVFFTLYVGILIMGERAGSDLLIGNIYTLMPAIMVILFIILFKTESLENISNQFEYPGTQWILFGLYYTIGVLSLTIITGFLIGGLTVNQDYNPFRGELASLTTRNPLIDIVVYIIVVGFLLIFSPGGFIRVIGEEVGWRGYLLPEFIKLRPKISIFLTSTIVGFIWFIYHLPYFTILAPVAPEYLFYFVVGSAGVFFGANWAMMWAFLKTRNIWPALSLHFLWNLISPLFTGNIYSKTTGLLNPSLDNIWLVNGEGLIGGFFHFIVGLGFLYLIIKNEDELLTRYKSLESVNDMKTSLTQMKIKRKNE